MLMAEMETGKRVFGRLVLIRLSMAFFTSVSGMVDENYKDLAIDYFGIPHTHYDQYLPSYYLESTKSSDIEQCDCVPFYQCINESFTNYAVGVTDLKIEFNVCKDASHICCNKTPEFKKPAFPLEQIKRKECGLRNPDGVGYKLTGAFTNEAQFGEFPWMVALGTHKRMKNSSLQYKYECGGSLIHLKVVLTAAHCVVGLKDSELTVRAGEWDFNLIQNIYPNQDRRIHKVIIHEQFSSGTRLNDIAILIVDKPFVRTDNVDTICLPQQDEEALNTVCIVSGWGKMKSHGKEGKITEILRQVQLPIVPKDKCLAALRETRLGERFQLHKSFVCAGKEGADACEFNGGSPLICPIKDGKEMQYQQVGIVAWGIGCGTKTPGVYVNVAHFIEWINVHLTRHSLELKLN